MLSLRVLGGVSIRVEQGSPAGEAAQARRAALLALLANARGRAVGREKLLGYLWPDVGEERARHLLSESLYQLRKAFGAEVLLTEGDAIRLNPETTTCDATEFETAIEHGDLESAVALYAGPFLDGFFVKGAPEFERWVESERSRLADSYATALETLAERDHGAGNYIGAVGRWKRLISHDQYNSRYVSRLMRSMVAAGDPANAIQEAEEHTRFLQQELGTEPPEDLLAFAERLRTEPAQGKLAAVDGGASRAQREQPADQAPQPEPLVTPRVFARRRLANRRGVLVAVAGAVVVIVAVIAVLRLAPGRLVDGTIDGAPVDPANRIAVLPFTYRGSEEFAYLGESMNGLLSTMLDGVGNLHAVDPQAVRGISSQLATPGSDVQRDHAVAERLAAGRFVTGEVVELDGRLRIDARLHSRTGEPADAVPATAEREVDDFFGLVDDLVRQLLLQLVGSAREHHGLAARTTDSLSALKSYLEGVAERRDWNFTEAFAAFRRAVEIDSAFALGWHGMAATATWVPMMEWDAGIEASSNAVRLSGSLPPRMQSVIRAFSAMMHGDAPEAERLSRAVLADYPDDVQAWWVLTFSLGLNAFYGRPAGESRPPAERAYHYDPQDPDHQAFVAWWATVDGDWDRLALVWPNPFLAEIVRAFGSGDTVAQERIVREATPDQTWAFSLAGEWLGSTRGALNEAVRLARLVPLGSWPAEARALNGHLLVAELELGRGRLRAAQAALAEVANIFPMWADLYRALWATAPYVPPPADLQALSDAVARWDTDAIRPSVVNAGVRAHDLLAAQLRLYALGRLALRQGDTEAALRYAAMLEEIDNPPEALSFAVDRAQGLRARVHFDRGEFEDALAALEAQPRRIRIQWLYNAPFYPSPEDRFLRGETYERLGRYDEALGWYAGINAATVHDAPYLAVAHLRRAEIYDQLGQTGNAALHYRRFIELWQDCDPELRGMVDAARRALQRLVAEPAES